jgi:hypothetical protein
MFSVILYMLRHTVDNRARLLLFPSFSPLTVTFPKLSVIFHSLYVPVGAKKHRCPYLSEFFVDIVEITQYIRIQNSVTLHFVYVFFTTEVCKTCFESIFFLCNKFFEEL